MPHASSAQVGDLLREWQSGRKGIADEFFNVLYPELRRLAAVRMSRERGAHSWQPTLLVNELYLELLKNNALDHSLEGEEQCQAFLRLAGFLMTRLLILHSRPLKRRVSRDTDADLSGFPSSSPNQESLQFVDQLLARLGEVDPKLRTVVELKVFEGRSHDEIARDLGCSTRSVGAYWSFARRWLEQELLETPD
ncbi:ECF-type sigma factor [Bryobacter aggregatus]|uniref:ECF-type sigma factor n=1 Tax=Bryobacter aggregatus TaxID=360054 RepID=UPI0004E13B27|nr:ECF-type sigma factor [Bryobacter aggregatus]